jgi:hypothetical protein
MRKSLCLIVFIAIVIDLPYYIRQADDRFPLLVSIKVASLLCSFVSLASGCIAASKLLGFVRIRQTAATFVISAVVHAFQLVFFMRSASNSMCDDWICFERDGDCKVSTRQLDDGPGKPEAFLHIVALCVLLTVQVRLN